MINEIRTINVCFVEKISRNNKNKWEKKLAKS